MRKVILLMHVSLDGFVARPGHEMDWIKLPEDLWDYVQDIVESADTALYGARTFRMMESYWPTAAEQPGASRHDVVHARWVNAATKLVFSRSELKTGWNNTRVIHDEVKTEMTRLKDQPGKNLLMLGSPTLAQSFMDDGLIDDFYLNLSPVALGAGLPLFTRQVDLKFVAAKFFGDGVLGLHYQKP